ncbi:MAG: Trm112 family protein [Phenylobacterium sp.]|uniref:Trm112 family protein n=1 Tax=Phenylobacterium sp. TaxID=1871053 RepID=UPI0027210D19|nr:Trm112 family protein [Phenylobacterium sp.]MDO8410322.1 Trm112 family protein [Phenylobacterium sp.]
MTQDASPPETDAAAEPFPALTAEIDPRLLEILVCPVTHGRLDYDRDKAELISQGAKLAYPIRDGVPIMLPEEARALEA